MKQLVWVIFILLNSNTSGYSKKKVLMKKLEQCNDKDDLPIVLSNVSIYQESKGYYLLAGVIDVKKDLPNNWILKVEMHKCSDGYNPNSCEIYLDSLKNNDGCNVMKQLSIYYKDVFRAINPKMECPTKAGIYSIERCSINEHTKYLLSYGSIPSIFIRAEGFSEDEQLFCVESRFDLTNRQFNVTDKS